MKKRRKPKKNVIYIGLAIIVGIFLISVVVDSKIKEYNYKKSYEYKLLMKGWKEDQVDELLTLYKDNLDDILNKRVNDDIINFAKEKYFIYSNLDKYISYKKENKDKSLTDVVALINTKANNEWYTNDIDTDISLVEKMLVNKFYHLNQEYNPDDIVNVSTNYSYGNQKLRKVAYDAFVDMWNAAKDDGIKLIINSSYRDFESQDEIYNDYKNWYGQTKADTQAARAGYSEHQTGLAIDVFSSDNTLSGTFKDSEGYTWLKQNAYKYGYIERYPEGKAYLTGYEFESWHWRYIGKEAASVIQKENITYDEYYAYYIEKK